MTRHAKTGRRRKERLLALLMAPAVLAGCPQTEDVPIAANPWVRHTIDDRFSGADGVKLGDLNGDGRVDLVVPWEESGVVTVHVNPGSARVEQPWPTVQVGSVGAVEDAVFVDLDDDGNLDVVSCSQGSVKTMHVHWAPADPSAYMDADAWKTEPIPVTQGARKWMFCEPARIDGKHGVDLVAGAKGDDGRVGWLEAPANPRDLSAWRWHSLSAASWIMSIVPVDLNGDGLLDIVASDRKGATRGCFWLLNRGPGLLQTLPWPIQRISMVAEEAMFLDVSDLDNDGQLDVVVVTDDRELVWYRPTELLGAGWIPSRINWSERFGTGKGVRLADLDLDGQVDIVFTCENAGGKYGVGWLSRQSLMVADSWLAQPISATAGAKFDLPQVHDLDSDGDLDVITCEEATGLGVIWYENPAILGSSVDRSF